MDIRQGDVVPVGMTVPVYRVALVMEAEVPGDWRSISTAESASRVLRRHLGDADRERFMVLLLDVKNRPIGVNTVAVGSLDGCTVHPREVFKPAVLANAAGVVLCHNHPSGMAAVMKLGIKVLDHIILGGGISGTELHQAWRPKSEWDSTRCLVHHRARSEVARIHPIAVAASAAIVYHDCKESKGGVLMLEIAKVTVKGQITIPVDIRKRLRIKEGDKVLFLQEGDRIIFTNASFAALEQAQRAMSERRKLLG